MMNVPIVTGICVKWGVVTPCYITTPWRYLVNGNLLYASYHSIRRLI